MTNAGKKIVYIRGWKCGIPTHINSTDTVKDIYYRLSHVIGIPNGSYLWINRSPVTKKNNIKLLDEDKPLFDYGLINRDIITVVSPIAIIINKIQLTSIYMDVMDSVCDLRYNLILLGVIDKDYEFTLRSDYIKFYSKYISLRNVFNNLNLKVYVEYGKKLQFD